MSQTRIGSCSICGGDVLGHTGPWWGVCPPPPARCARCGAVEDRGDVIRMRPCPPQSWPNVYPTYMGAPGPFDKKVTG